MQEFSHFGEWNRAIEIGEVRNEGLYENLFRISSVAPTFERRRKHGAGGQIRLTGLVQQGTPFLSRLGIKAKQEIAICS